MPHFEVIWEAEHDFLRVIEPTAEEIAASAPALVADYNDPHNRSMMAHVEDMTSAEVIAVYADLRAHAGRPFLLYRNDVLMGDADLRRMHAGCAEFAVMVGSRAAQGRGLGTRFAIMIHALAFRRLMLERIYVSIIPRNSASRRLFAKLGYVPDDSPAARGYTDEASDISMSIGRAQFEHAHAAVLDAIRWDEREPASGATSV